MQRAENQVPRQSGLDGNIRNDTVTNLTDQYDIRGLSQHRPQYSIERQLNVISNLALIHPRKVVFNRVLRRNNLLVGLIKLLQSGVQRRSLAASGRASNQEDTVGPLDYLLELLEVILLKSKSLDAYIHRIRTQNSQNNARTMVPRQ